MEKREKAVQAPAFVRVEKPGADGVYFHDRFILVQENGRLKALSANCTHLGCRIREQEGNQLVCPCHGSRYTLQGNVVKGPARKDLKTLTIETGSKENEAIVHL